MNLIVEETKSRGKTVVIEQQPEEFPVDEDFVRDIDEVLFRLVDLSGASPDKKVASDQGHQAPYSSPDEHGFFTPIKLNPKSLSKDIEVNNQL